MVIQLISLIIAVIGLFLAYIEVRNPDKADRIENTILDLGKIKWPPKSDDFQYKRTWRIFISIEVIAMLSIYLSVLPYLVYRYVVILINSSNPSVLSIKVVKMIPLMIVIMIPLLFAPILVPVFIIKGMAKSIKWLNETSNGHALGAFGLMIAALGILIALFQTIIMILI